jgi:hypothetical protein
MAAMKRHLAIGLCLCLSVGSVALAQAGRATLGGIGHIGSSTRPTINALQIPIGGYIPFVGLGLTDEFKNDNAATVFQADSSFFPSGTWLGGEDGYFDVALLDTGASVSLLTAGASAGFDLVGHGFDGTEALPLGGATGLLEAVVTDPLGIYITGLANRTTTGGSFSLDTSSMVGMTNMAIAEAPPEWTLPSIVGIPLASQFTTVLHADDPQIFRHDDRTIRTPQIEFLPLGSGSQGIVRRAPLTLKNATGFNVPPNYFPNFESILNGDPFSENPSTPSVLGGADAGLFLTVSIENDGNSKQSQLFLFDTGATVSAVSEVVAAELGFDPVLDEPDFEVQVEGSGGTIESVPGFIAEELRIATVGGSFTLRDVPLVVLDITDPSNIGNVLPGLIGTNLFTDRNIVIDPLPSAGGGGVGPSLYISDPITLDRQWAAAAPTASWHDAANWSTAETPGPLWAADVRNVTTADQTAKVSQDSQIHRLNVFGGANGQRMNLVIEEAATLWVFSGVGVEQDARIQVAGTLDSQFVELQEGAVLEGTGTVRTDEFENRHGVLSPGSPVGELVIEGIFANRDGGTLAIDLGGTTPGTQHDVLTVDGDAFLGGTLAVSLVDAGSGLFRPQIGDKFEILATTGEGSVLGVFDELRLPSQFEWDVLYLNDAVRLEVLDVLELLLGDYNGNGRVEQADLDLVLLNWGADATTPPADWISDLPAGSIDQEELDRVLLNWGSAAGQTLISVGGAVPEPTSAVLVGIAAMGVILLTRPFNACFRRV